MKPSAGLGKEVFPMAETATENKDAQPRDLSPQSSGETENVQNPTGVQVTSGAVGDNSADEDDVKGSGNGAGRARANARTERRATMTPAERRRDTIASRARSERAQRGLATRQTNAETRRRAALSPQQRAAETRRANRAAASAAPAAPRTLPRRARG